MNKRIFLALPFLLAGMVSAQQKTTPVATTTSAVAPNLTEDQKASYYIGLDIARNMKRQGFNLDVDMLSKAMKEELAGSPKLLPESEMNSFLQAYSQKMNEKKMAEEKALGEANKQKGIAFLEQNKKNKNIKTTASGLQYEVLKEGDKVTKPKETDMVTVKYTGKLIDGTVFDSTEKNGGQPIDIPLNGVIKGWTEGIQLMSKGSSYRFYIPSDLAYGERGAGNVIPPESTLIFDVELENIKDNTPPPPPPAPAK